jgi:hypothetical protein
MIGKPKGRVSAEREPVLQTVMRQELSMRVLPPVREARQPREDPMVDKTVTQSPVVIELSRYRDRAASSRAPALSVRLCRHCGAKLTEGEREDECSAIPNVDIAGMRLRWQAAQILRGLS